MSSYGSGDPSPTVHTLHTVYWAQPIDDGLRHDAGECRAHEHEERDVRPRVDSATEPPGTITRPAGSAHKHEKRAVRPRVVNATGHSREPCRPCPSTTRTARRRATRHASPPSDDLVVRSERLLSDAAPPPVTWSDGRQRRRTLRHPAPPANLVHIRNVRPPSRTASPCAVLCHIGDLRPRSRRRPPSRMWTKIADGYRPAAPRRRA